MTAKAAKTVAVEDIVDIPAEEELRGVKRGTFDDFCKQLAKEKLVQGITVRPHPTLPGKWQLVDGRHRAAAYRRNGRARIKAQVEWDMTDEELALATVVANVQRTNYTPYEEAVDLQELTKLGMGQAEIAQRIGKSQGHVSKRMALLKLPEGIANRVGNGLDIKDATWFAPLTAKPAWAKIVGDHVAELGQMWPNWFANYVEEALANENVTYPFDASHLQTLMGWTYTQARDVVDDGHYKAAIGKLDIVRFAKRTTYGHDVVVTDDETGVKELAAKALTRVQNRLARQEAARKKNQEAFEATPEGQEAKKQAEGRDAQRTARAARSKLEREATAAVVDDQIRLAQDLVDRDVDEQQLFLAMLGQAFESRRVGPAVSAAEQGLLARILGEYAKTKQEAGDVELARKLLHEDRPRALRYIAAVLFLQERREDRYYMHTQPELVNGILGRLVTGQDPKQLLDEHKQRLQEVPA